MCPQGLGLTLDCKNLTHVVGNNKIDISEVEENSEEWYKLSEIVGFFEEK